MNSASGQGTYYQAKDDELSNGTLTYCKYVPIIYEQS